MPCSSHNSLVYLCGVKILTEINKRYPKDQTKVSLIFGNISEDDILLRDTLDDVDAKYPNFHLHYTLDRPSSNWTGSTGFVTQNMIQEHLPAPGDSTLILLCGRRIITVLSCVCRYSCAHYCVCLRTMIGPPPMVQAMEKNLSAMGYGYDQVYTF